MCCVSLYDTVTLNFDAADISVVCSHPDVPEDETNLAWRAAHKFLSQTQTDAGIEIILEKKIPVAAGLGGGSSDAAAVLSGLNRYYDQPLSQEELSALGLTLGADVPFFIFRKPAIAEGVGEKLKRFHRIKPLPVLLVYPEIHVSTTSVYDNFNLGLTKCKQRLKKHFFDNEHSFDMIQCLYNDLETVTMHRHSEVRKAQKALIRYGAGGALMSGSGPTVFGLFDNNAKAESAKKELLTNSRWQVFHVEMLV
jgi:4-diphosphocytidyl-2-C-methyl-D-erythritol kinase